MLNNIQSFTVTSKTKESDWHFIPNLFSGTLGIIIGCVIAQYVGLIEIANFLY